MRILKLLGTSLVRIALIASLIAVQLHIWFSESGYKQYQQITSKISSLESDNRHAVNENKRLEKAVVDLNQDGELLSSNAREHLGMIGPGETLYQVKSN